MVHVLLRFGSSREARCSCSVFLSCVVFGCRCDHCYRLPGLFCCKLLLLLLLQDASGSETVAKCVYISRENVLQQASKYLSLEMQEIRTCAIGKDQIIASVCINAPPFGKYSMLHQKKIFGDYKLTAEAALESAKLATLLHLKKMGVFYVDDINLSEVAKCEAKLADCP